MTARPGRTTTTRALTRCGRLAAQTAGVALVRLGTQVANAAADTSAARNGAPRRRSGDRPPYRSAAAAAARPAPAAQPAPAAPPAPVSATAPAPPAPVSATAPAPPVAAPTPFAHPRRRRADKIDLALRIFAGVYLVTLLVAVVVYKAAFAQMLFIDPYFAAYGLVVAAFIVTRFGLSLAYRPARDAGLEPQVAIVMPAFNEEAAIASSINSLLALDYPEDKLEVVVINDGSSDRTLAEIWRVARANPRVQVIDFPCNRGKRAAMAAGIRATSADVIAFVDSDCELEPDALRIIVQGFADEKVGAIAGHANVLNVEESWLTRMQAVRYFVAFKVNKAAESVFNVVTCCSGCFSVYRRAAIMPRLDWWEHQTFLGAPSTFGDDRSLTNCVLRTWKVKYESRAVSHTIVPATFRKFMVQQLRWKRSWTRESLIVGSFVWKKNPLGSAAVYVGIALPLVAPVTAVRAVVFQPVIQGAGAPFIYLAGIYMMALAYGLYYALRHSRYDALWIWGVVFCFFYLAFLLWQTYYAMLTTRSSSWGTRAAAKPPPDTGVVAAPVPGSLPMVRA
ncbi:MAG TPA: glycosyltransferase [Solirubrobacteraceae bacterium]|nr:glycosyltransferase [Solirubrobacteraceae bacterium]